jgi:hypothetical protein
MTLPNPRAKLPIVIRRAAQVDLSSVIETELETHGKRLSTSEGYQGFGPIERITEWTPDVPFDAVDWDLTWQTSPRELQVIYRLQRMNRDWFIAADASRTMHFGTEGDIKLVTGATLVASFAQAALQNYDQVTQAVFDERHVGKVLENATTEEMVLAILSHDATKVKARTNDRSGLSAVLTQLPDNPSTVILISDFLNLREEDKARLVQASHYHTLFCCVVEDAREIRFPKASGQLTLTDMSTGRQEVMSFAEADKLVGEERDARIAELTDCFRKARARFSFFEGGDSTTTIRNKIMRMLQNGA